MRRLSFFINLLFAAAFLVYGQGESSSENIELQREATTSMEDEKSGDGASESSSASDEMLQNLSGKIDGLNESYLETKGNVDKLSKIKISGYVQTQTRYAPDNLDATYKIGDFSGGAFPSKTRTMTQIRRGRVKVAYVTTFSEGVVQLDIVPKGVSMKDAYLKFVEPYYKSIGMKAGLFDRPFGFEIMYSSSSRESPERSRLFQTLFPGERDLGFSLEFLPDDNLPAIYRTFNLRAGVFNGTGIADESDDNKDIIGRAGVTVPLPSAGIAIDAGLSGYYGKVTSASDTIYKTSNKAMTVITGNKDKKFERAYAGADIQLYYDVLPIGGTSLRAEFITGEQPGSKSDSKVNLSGSLVAQRKFMGYYINAVQNLGLKFQAVAKYDLYDPNTKVEGDEIKKGSNLSGADIAYTTFGGGLVYHLDENVKFVLYYDMIMNESVHSDLTGDKTLGTYTKDIDDDVLTFRIQYKF